MGLQTHGRCGQRNHLGLEGHWCPQLRAPFGAAAASRGWSTPSFVCLGFITYVVDTRCGTVSFWNNTLSFWRINFLNRGLEKCTRHQSFLLIYFGCDSTGKNSLWDLQVGCWVCFRRLFNLSAARDRWSYSSLRYPVPISKNVIERGLVFRASVLTDLAKPQFCFH